MAVVIGSDDTVRRIVSALGLERCTDLSLHFSVGEAVTVAATQYVTRDQLAGVADILETGEFELTRKETPAVRAI